MMPDLTASLKRVPRWAWLTSAGVAIGGVAVYTVRNRAGIEDADATATGDESAITGYPDGGMASPVPGIVVPDINLGGDTAGESGYLDLHNAYLSGLQTLLDTLTTRPYIEPSPASPVPVQVTITPTGGGAASTPRNGVVTAPKPASQTRPCRTYKGHTLSWWRSARNAKCKNGKWNWPGPGGCSHTVPFRGNQPCDGGNCGQKRDC